eukprot:TRINITY_DN61116_c0_g1_i1.p1 TRINITY_DN61116_c0_g1~~TRINITY_DN61116_c0_g1_i1.p1  ORF type:complete len:251 (+),score=64.11 TRINITY_DN61116_c0_g1_i1:65-817(+)
MAAQHGVLREVNSPVRMQQPALTRHMPGQRLRCVRGEGEGLLPLDHAVVGRDCSFQCLLMAELGRARREHDARRRGGSSEPPEQPSEPAPESPAPPSSPYRSPQSSPRRVVLSHSGAQTETGHGCEHRATMTEKSMGMTDTREVIIRQQQQRISDLQAELAELHAVVDDEPEAVKRMLNHQERHWVLCYEEKLEEETRTRRIFDTAAAINLRDLGREREREERRVQRRERRCQQVELEIGEVTRLLCEAG